MRSAVIVSTARTPIGRAHRAASNDTQTQALGGQVVAQAVQPASIDPAEAEDVAAGAAGPFEVS
jgi:acetyl-CoA C-acetyltransferase